jgi:hypothetical protein
MILTRSVSKGDPLLVSPPLATQLRPLLRSCLALTILVLFGASLCCAQVSAVTAPGCDPTSVGKTLNGLSTYSGVVVVTIPACTSQWTSAVSYTVPAAITNLTIQGQTTVTCTGAAGTSTYACTSTDNTVFVDNIAGPNFLTFNINGASTYFRLTGITVQGGTSISSAYAKLGGMIGFTGNSPNVRIDHVHANTTTYSFTPSNALRVTGTMEGVLDHSVITLQSAENGDYVDGVQVYTSQLDTIGFGDGSWSSPSYWGSRHFFFIESNSFLGGFPDDCYQGARLVMRYNSFVTGAVIQDHPTYNGGGRPRGCRELEVYHNYYSAPVGYSQAVGMRGATALVWDNTLTSGFQEFMSLWTDRNTNTHNESANRTSNPEGWGYCGTTVASNGVGSVWDGNNPATTGYPCLDGVGRGQSDPFNGADFIPYSSTGPLDAITGTVTWPHQYLEPVYAWGNNTGGAGYLSISNGDVVTQNNREVYYDCGSLNSSCSGGFTGAAGTGTGTLANRPPTCTAGPGGTYGTSPTGSYGVAYFATDANSGQGELYVCTSTNNWTAVYEPYTYPHPLTSGLSNSSSTSSNAPQPPTNLVSSVQ